MKISKRLFKKIKSTVLEKEKTVWHSNWDQYRVSLFKDQSFRISFQNCYSNAIFCFSVKDFERGVSYEDFCEEFAQ